MTTRDKADDPDGVQVPLVWVGIDDAPIEFLNQFLVQVEDQEFILTLGALAPPIIMGTLEDRREQAARVRFVPVRTLGRYGMTEHRLEELINVLTGFLAQHRTSRREKK